MNINKIIHQGKKLLTLGFTQSSITSRYEILIQESCGFTAYLCVNFFSDCVFINTRNSQDGEYYQETDLSLPHIKTFKQLEKLYFSLTNKKFNDSNNKSLGI